MTAHAIVIGVNEYPHNPQWNLTGAADDAIAFAQWALARGGVALDNLTLHLSPVTKAPAALAARTQPADIDAIKTTLSAYRNKKRGEGAERLWFYYAGHGLAAPGEGPSAGPVIIPADVDDLAQYMDDERIALEIFRERMQVSPPKLQFYFVDACRDVLETSDHQSLTQRIHWDPRGLSDAKLATQVVFLATTAGRKAKELRDRGVFSDVLLSALDGIGPTLTDPSDPMAEPGDVRLVFAELEAFVRKGVAARLEQETDINEEDRECIPFAQIVRASGDLEIARFNLATLPKAEMVVVVHPPDARDSARIEFVQRTRTAPYYLSLPEPPPAGPPVDEQVSFEVDGGTHTVRVRSASHGELRRNVLAFRQKKKLFRFELPPLPPEAELEGILNVRGPQPVQGSLKLRCADPLARLTVTDFDGKVVARGQERISVQLGPGEYTAAAELTASTRTEQTFVIEAGETLRLELELKPAGEYAANVRLSSRLANAAWAARWSRNANGVDPLPNLDPGATAVQVLIGDAHREGAFLAECRVVLEWGQSAMLAGNVIELGESRTEPLELRPLPGEPDARQASSTREHGGSLRVRLTMPGFASTSFVLAQQPGFVTVLIVARESHGAIEVQQHLNPIDPSRPAGPMFEPPRRDDVRAAEIAWRALENREPLTDLEFEELLIRKRGNPMFGVIAGYRMLHSHAEKNFRAEALPNMLKAFAALPDVHVLAGLYDPEDRDAHFARAMDAGTPVLVEGFWTLLQWLTQRAMRDNQPPPALRFHVAQGTVWTSFTDPPRAARADDVRVVTSAGRTATGSMAEDPEVAAAARSVARLDAAAEAFLCSTFLVAPRIIVIPIHFARMLAEEQPDGSWTMRMHLSARFDHAEIPVARVLRAIRPAGDGEPDPGSLEGSLSECWPVLLELDEDAGVPPLEIADAAPELGDPVAVIGYPRSDARVPSDTFAALFTGVSGEKHVMSGVVLRAPEETWSLDYDCFTADGTSGGPVVDRDGRVVGMHVAGRATPQGRKRAIGLALTRLPRGGW